MLSTAAAYRDAIDHLFVAGLTTRRWPDPRRRDSRIDSTLLLRDGRRRQGLLDADSTRIFAADDAGEARPAGRESPRFAQGPIPSATATARRRTGPLWLNSLMPALRRVVSAGEVEEKSRFNPSTKYSIVWFSPLRARS